MKNTRIIRAIATIALFVLGFLSVQAPAQAGIASGENWTTYENISKTPTSSTYPTVAADKAGNLHVIWIEDVGGKTKNLISNPDGSPRLDYRGKQVNYLNRQGNTLYYTRWNGKRWLQPVDVEAILQGNIYFPSAVVDNKGILHVIWSQGNSQFLDLMYSQVPADKAEDVRMWSKPVSLVSNVYSYDYPSGISADSTGGLHIVYYRLGPAPGVYAINSMDGGQNWSYPVLIYANKSDFGSDDGSLPVRLAIDKKDRLHATWTRYDISGNGKAIYYSQSTDLGKTWSLPFEVAFWRPGYYETDWLSVGVVGDTIYLEWEGGPVARSNERISKDGGLTWSDEKVIFPNLVGENGWADLVTDSSDQLYQIVVKRILGVKAGVYGTWYSELKNGQWDTPMLIDPKSFDFYDNINSLDANGVRSLLNQTINDDGLRYQRSAILDGNELFVVVVNEYDGEIYSAHVLLDAPYIAPQPYPQSSLPNNLSVTQIATQPALEPTPELPILDKDGHQQPIPTGSIFIFSIIPVALLIIISLVIRLIMRKN